MKVYFNFIDESTRIAEMTVYFNKTEFVLSLDDIQKSSWEGVTPVFSTNGRCGSEHGNTICPGSQCCSTHGWCAGNIGTLSDWCSVRKDVNTINFTYIGGQSKYDGVDIKGMKVQGNSDPIIDPTISTNRRCWPNNNKICPDTKCCGFDGWCGGNKPSYSPSYCAIYDTMIYEPPKFGIPPRLISKYKGVHSKYDGDGRQSVSYIVRENNLTDLLNDNLVLKCSKNDPLRNNNGSIYKWDTATE